MCTMREWTAEELQNVQRVLEIGVTFPEYYRKQTERLQADLAWYATDESRPCWTVTELFEIPVIYTQASEWEEWLEDHDNPESVTIVEGTITGKEAGDLEYFEP